MHFFRHLFLGSLVCLCFVGRAFVSGAISDFSPAGAAVTSDDESIVLEAIAGTRDFRINSKKDQFEKPWFDGRDLRFIHCVRPAKCEKLRNNTCFGSKLPYTSTSLDLTDSFSQEESREKLYNYEALRNIPKCWAVIQPFLCAVFAPKCEIIKNHSMVYLPSLEMCRITSEPCRILYNTSYFPEFLKCNETFFPSKCNNDVREMKFNAVGQCLVPLVQAESSTSYYKDIEGCGVQCKDPLYTDDEHDDIHKLIGWGVTICAISNIFVIVTFSIYECKKTRYPAWIIVYINICFLINWIGWMVQFIPGNRENIVCRKDGTLRHSEPSAGENLSCIVPFILIYYFLLAAMVWFAIFTYAFYLKTKDADRDRIDKKASYFHLIAWSLPLVLTITIMALSEVDGNSIVGICFVGYRNHAIRAGLVLGPVGGLVLISSFFILRIILQVNSLKKEDSKKECNYEEFRQLQSITRKLIIRSMFGMLFIVCSFVFQFYEFRNSHDWSLSLDDYILCKIKSAYSDTPVACKLESRPSVAILQLRLLCIFGICMANSSWCWTKYTLNTWSRFFKRKLGHDISEGENFTKPAHKVIADMFAKRNDEIISVSIADTHTDPAGVNFDMNNLNLHNSTEPMRASLIGYLHKILKRRDALTGSIPQINMNNYSTRASSTRASSCDSELSVKMRTITMESRRSSIDSQVSQVSVKLSETEFKTTVENHRRKGLKMRTKQRYGMMRKASRKASSSSIESQIITTAALKKKNNKIRFQSNTSDSNVTKGRRMDRRSACASIDVAGIMNKLHADGRDLLSSDDDDLSLATVKIHEAQSNIFMQQQHMEMAYNQDDSADSSEIVSEVHLKQQHYQAGIERYLCHNGRTNGDDAKIIYGRSNVTAGMKNSLKNKQSTRTNTRNVTVDHNEFPSTSSELDIPLGATHSTYSGISLGNKTHSRNSKGSCDVGIQANAFDITSSTMEIDESQKAICNGHQDDDDEEFNENHQFLPNKKRGVSIVANNNNAQLISLLFPTK